MTVHLSFYHHITDEELGITFQADSAPRVGEFVHYWQDTFPRGGYPDIRYDFEVIRVVHDLRYMPPIGNGQSKYVHSVVLYVKEVKQT